VVAAANAKGVCSRHPSATTVSPPMLYDLGRHGDATACSTEGCDERSDGIGLTNFVPAVGHRGLYLVDREKRCDIGRKNARSDGGALQAFRRRHRPEVPPVESDRFSNDIEQGKLSGQGEAGREVIHLGVTSRAQAERLDQADTADFTSFVHDTPLTTEHIKRVPSGKRRA
jgi:hypothetical protein